VSKVAEKVSESKFFSRYAQDVICMETTKFRRIGDRDVPVLGKTIEFVERWHITDDPEVIKFLRGHILFGKEIFEYGFNKVHDTYIHGHDKLERLATLERKEREAVAKGGFRER